MKNKKFGIAQIQYDDFFNIKRNGLNEEEIRTIRKFITPLIESPLTKEKLMEIHGINQDEFDNIIKICKKTDMLIERYYGDNLYYGLTESDRKEFYFKSYRFDVFSAKLEMLDKKKLSICFFTRRDDFVQIEIPYDHFKHVIYCSDIKFKQRNRDAQ